jgi:hypothetical protein
MKYRKKPVEIEAIQLLNTPQSIREITTFIDGKNPDTKSMYASDMWDNYVSMCQKKGGILIKTLESQGDGHFASFGDYIIKGVKGEFYACKPDIFEMTYDLVTEEINNSQCDNCEDGCTSPLGIHN